MVNLSACLLLLFVTDVMSVDLNPRMLNGNPQPFYENVIFNIKHIKDGSVVKSCLGIKLNYEWLITSAFCLLKNDSSQIIAEAQIDGGNHVERYTNWRTRIHPDFEKETGRHDIGLLALEESPRYISKKMKEMRILPFSTNFQDMIGVV
ncbi:uncharacterized protein LOC123005262 [Tribolium madens]|uniref:uncharacterized protein LOC123005262 n=1 Tax=Tribolium madens TaxID=41895 RepID=UPI001CF73B1D|nr:uncharacterized protein LOC123005262 [Tribolium madens]